MKIYIIGSVASGKTTLAKKLSRKLNIEYYELDKIVWDDSKGIRYEEEKISDSLKKILNKKDWIIEDVGRKRFEKGIEEADIIYFIKLKKLVIRYRILKRWLKQKLKLEHSNYKPTFSVLFEMYKWSKEYNNYFKLERLKNYNDKLVILDNKKIKELI